MNLNISKFQLIIIAIVLLLIFINNCGDWGWEDLESNHESVLNVFGLISLDSTIQSFVTVHQTIDLQDEESEIVRKDTIWYGDSPYDYILEGIYVSNFLVRDANVIISDGKAQYHFFPVVIKNSERYYDYEGHYVAVINEIIIYLDTLKVFNPQPNTTYYLELTTPDGRHLTGKTTTPPIPDINEEAIPDTIHTHKPFKITWNSLGEAYAKIRTEAFTCGGFQEGIIEPGDTSWVSEMQNCADYEKDTAVEMMIELRAMDKNYYDYFIKESLDDDFANFLLGSSYIGESYGLEGGQGVFGAIATDRIYRLSIP